MQEQIEPSLLKAKDVLEFLELKRQGVISILEGNDLTPVERKKYLAKKRAIDLILRGI